MRKCKYIILGCFILIGLSACGSSTTQPKKKTTTEIYTVKTKQQVTPLYFSGNVEPIDVVNVPAPVDGTVEHIFFHYGQRVHKGEALLTLKSNKLMEDYQQALTSYLKGKDTYITNKLKMEGTEELNAAGLIPRNTFEQEKSQLADSYLSYTQAKSKLNNIVSNAKGFIGKHEDLTSLSLEDVDKVQKALSIQLNELTIKAPSFGIILAPTKGSNNGSGNNSDSKVLKEGSSVKENQSLVSLGDFSGLSVKINVNEININAIHPGQRVSVTGVAFPGISLQGHVSAVDVQAVASETGGLPTFPVLIVVPKLTKLEAKTIHIGMSAKVELMLKSKKQMMVPIKAVFQKEGRTLVKLVTKQNPLQTKNVAIITGKPDISDVVVISGLKVGDKILVNH